MFRLNGDDVLTPQLPEVKRARVRVIKAQNCRQLMDDGALLIVEQLFGVCKLFSQEESCLKRKASKLANGM